MCLLRFAFFCVSLLISQLAFAGQATSDFRDFPSGSKTFLPPTMPAVNLTTIFTPAGPVKVSNSAIDGVFAGPYTGTETDPSAGSGWISAGQMVLNAEVPVRALGVTFSYFGNDFGSTLSAYDGPDGSGQLLGQVTSSWSAPPFGDENVPMDFVGIISDQANIRSAVLTSQSDDAVQIATIAVSIPEPTSVNMLVAGCMLLGLAGARRS